MSNSTHSPGPWMVEPINGGQTYQITSAESRHFAVIAETPVDGTGADEANARLIAAAPELLAALEVVRRSAAWSNLSLETQSLICAAIAKAEGR